MKEKFVISVLIGLMVIIMVGGVFGEVVSDGGDILKLRTDLTPDEELSNQWKKANSEDLKAANNLEDYWNQLDSTQQQNYADKYPQDAADKLDSDKLMDVEEQIRKHFEEIVETEQNKEQLEEFVEKSSEEKTGVKTGAENTDGKFKGEKYISEGQEISPETDAGEATINKDGTIDYGPEGDKTKLDGEQGLGEPMNPEKYNPQQMDSSTGCLVGRVITGFAITRFPVICGASNSPDAEKGTQRTTAPFDPQNPGGIGGGGGGQGGGGGWEQEIANAIQQALSFVQNFEGLKQKEGPPDNSPPLPTYTERAPMAELLGLTEEGREGDVGGGGEKIGGVPNEGKKNQSTNETTTGNQTEDAGAEEEGEETITNNSLLTGDVISSVGGSRDYNLIVTKTRAGTKFEIKEKELGLFQKDGSTSLVAVPGALETYGTIDVKGTGINDVPIEMTNSLGQFSVSGYLLANVVAPKKTIVRNNAAQGGAYISAEWELAQDYNPSFKIRKAPITGSVVESSPITGAAITSLGRGQYINFIGHDVRMGGSRLLIEVLRNFEEVQGDGKKLWIKNGDMHIRFDGVKIYYSRRIKNTYHSIGLIDNVQDSKNKYSLIRYDKLKGRMMDSREKTSIGDLVVNHPRNHNLQIAKIRESMWVKR